MVQDVAFAMWMHRVRYKLEAGHGPRPLARSVLSDKPWKEWYDHGISTAAAVRRALN